MGPACNGEAPLIGKQKEVLANAFNQRQLYYYIRSVNLTVVVIDSAQFAKGIHLQFI